MKVFDKRNIRAFAFLPELLDDGNRVWLQWYNKRQYFGRTFPGFNPSEGHMRAYPRLSQNYWVTFYTWK